LPQQRTEGGEPSAPATPGLLLLSYTTPRDAAIPGISDDIWYQSDACFWELYEHGRRLLIATANFAHIVAPECIIKGPEDMKDFKAGWERTQEMQQLFMLMLSASNKRLETTAQGEN
jgi:hypothetical protein